MSKSLKNKFQPIIRNNTRNFLVGGRKLLKGTKTVFVPVPAQVFNFFKLDMSV